MSPSTRVTVVLLGLGASACCMSPTPVPRPDPDIVSAPVSSACNALCERIVACHGEMGATARPVDRDCATACAAGGMYADLSESTWACADQEECSGVWACASPEMAGRLVGSLATPGATPEDWPTDFPIVPGGEGRHSPPMGPVHVAIVAYASRTPSDVSAAYVAACAAAGWEIREGTMEHEAEAERFVATRGTGSVSVSVYADGTTALVQTMQLDALFAP